MIEKSSWCKRLCGSVKIGWNQYVPLIGNSHITITWPETLRHTNSSITPYNPVPSIQITKSKLLWAKKTWNICIVAGTQQKRMHISVLTMKTYREHKLVSVVWASAVNFLLAGHIVCCTFVGFFPINSATGCVLSTCWCCTEFLELNNIILNTQPDLRLAFMIHVIGYIRWTSTFLQREKQCVFWVAEGRSFGTSELVNSCNIFPSEWRLQKCLEF